MSFLRGGSVLVICAGAALLGGACGAADERLDPADLELRDLLGVAPRVAVGWDSAQREAARRVLADGLVEREPEALTVASPAPVLGEARLIGALAAVDDRLLDRDRDALGLVVVEHLDADPDGRAIDAPATHAALLGEVAATTTVLELDPAAWPCPGDQACDLGVLAALAADAAPGVARLRVVPVAQLTVIAALLPGDVPTLLVNPLVTAVGDPVVAAAASGAGGLAPAFAASPRPTVRVVPLVTATWTYDPSVSACASDVQRGCVTCLGGGACDDAIWSGVSGRDACTMLDAQPGRNYSLLCINLAVSLGDVGACLGRDAPSCAFDAMAILTPADLGNNVVFVDNATCRAALDACLDQLYGTSPSSSDGCGCDCGGCDCGDSSSSNDSCSSTDDQTDNCNNDSCNNDSCSGGGCGSGSGGGCGGGGSGGSCTVARSPSRGAGAAAGLVWVLMPVPAALLARRRARRSRVAPVDPVEPVGPTAPPTDPT